MTADHTEACDWLTDEVAGMADAFLHLKRQLKIHLGDPTVREAWRQARNLLRLTIAQGVYLEHPRGDQNVRFRRLMLRERYALEQAERRLDGEPGDDQ